ncbi:MAG: leucine-rich repeat domain-containing protein [Thermoguttaceae bacterium]|nr:leucine-rich repeat domain-containing protein [Thermoguttaceae bacterium]
MKFIKELLDYAVSRNLLSGENLLELLVTGIYVPDPRRIAEALEKRKTLNRLRLHSPLEIDEEDLLEAGSVPRSYSPDRRRWKGKKHSVGPELTCEQLNALVQEEMDNLVKKYSRFQALWYSWMAGKLAQVFADGFTLNDVYFLLGVELRDYHEFSGSVQAAYRQLLRQRKTVGSKYLWVMKSPDVERMAEFTRFQQELLQEVKALYEKDRETFARLSSQDGKLNFPSWEKAVQADMTSMKVWKILNLAAEPVLQETIEQVLSWKTELEFARKLDLNYVTELLANLENRDWSSLTVITARKIDDIILKSVVIPKDVQEIEDGAFEDCKTLVSVVIPRGVKKIGKKAFKDCTSLVSVEMPKGLKEIGEYAFYCCSSLTSLKIPRSVTEIGGHAFASCSSLTSVVIPKGVRVIWEETFSRCFGLASVVIPETVTEIGYAAFGGCCSLRHVVIPESVTKIGKEAFIACRPEKMLLSANGKILLDVPLGLSGEFVIPNGVEVIAPCVFCNRCSLESVVIPEGVKVIGQGAFNGCSSLMFAEIPQSVEVIENSAFCDYQALKTRIPDRLTKIGYDVFQKCSGHYEHGNN